MVRTGSGSRFGTPAAASSEARAATNTVWGPSTMMKPPIITLSPEPTKPRVEMLSTFPASSIGNSSSSTKKSWLPAGTATAEPSSRVSMLPLMDAILPSSVPSGPILIKTKFPTTASAGRVPVVAIVVDPTSVASARAVLSTIGAPGEVRFTP